MSKIIKVLCGVGIVMVVSLFFNIMVVDGVVFYIVKLC